MLVVFVEVLLEQAELVLTAILIAQLGPQMDFAKAPSILMSKREDSALSLAISVEEQMVADQVEPALIQTKIVQLGLTVVSV